MRKIQRLAAVGALAGLTVALGACGSEEEPAAGGGSETSAPSEPESSSAAPSGEGVTTIEDLIGPACPAVPTEGEGSAQGMVDDPVGTAASNNPLLTTLTQTVMAANLVDILNDPADQGSPQGMVDDPVGTAASNNPLLSTLADTVVAAKLVDTLNDPNKQYTVFAPANTAFEELEASSPGITDTLLAEPEGQLTTVLTYHLIPQRYDAQGLVEAGSVMSVQGGMVEITGFPDAPLVNGNQVLCGNIPTANATVFVIDSVLMPPAA